MKLLGGAVCLSLLLNVLVIWKLDVVKVHTDTLFSEHAGSATRQGENQATAKPSESTLSTEKLSAILMLLDELNSRLSSIEKELEESEIGSSTVDKYQEREATKELVFDSFSSTADSASEEWFWEEGTAGEESTLSFSGSDAFIVNSVICRAEWCRVELDTGDNEKDDLVSDLELHLKINESLGRDTKIVSGERNGSQRTLFIQ
jgi:hypothetical protein